MRSPALLGGVLLALACQPDDPASPDGGQDAGAVDAFPMGDAPIAMDAAMLDSGRDAASDPDAAAPDAMSPDAMPDAMVPDAPASMGFGALAGPCGMLGAELGEAAPSFFVTRLDFMMDPYDESDLSMLTPGGQRILVDGGLSESSILSEAFAYEVLARCQNARLLKTETEIAYEPMESKKTDLLVEMDEPDVGAVRIGVSVVRAVGFPPDAPYDEADAMRIIERKLDDILESSMNVVAEDAWEKQILVVMAYADMHAESVRSVWDGLDAETRADTIVYVVITDGDDENLYFNE